MACVPVAGAADFASARTGAAAAAGFAPPRSGVTGEAASSAQRDVKAHSDEASLIMVRVLVPRARSRRGDSLPPWTRARGHPAPTSGRYGSYSRLVAGATRNGAVGSGRRGRRGPPEHPMPDIPSEVG
ncbi:MAG: hypothetical protein ACK56I_24565, partial [bacterium]